MATNTYVALATYTVSGSSTNSYTFTSIPSTYTDLRIVINSKNSTTNNVLVQVGSGSVDTGSNYSFTVLYGDGSSAASSRATSQSSMIIGTSYSGWGMQTADIMNYTNSTTYKTAISRSNQAANVTSAWVNLWRSTSAIDTIKVYLASSANFDAGTTISLYGIAAEGQGYATGGYITSDASYYYHAFTSSGTFTPSRALTADILVVAGGGGGGGGGSTNAGEGGGGAGGLLGFTSQSLASGTGYTCTIGAGGSGGVGYGTNGTTGNNSTFGALTTANGGGGAGSYNGGGPSSGGSGAGGNGYTTNSSWSTGASGTSGQGYAGGNGNNSTLSGAGGGGGAGGIGGNYSSTNGGNGGIGSNAYSSWLSVTNLGVSGYIAGGGGGGSSGGSGGAAGAGGGGTGGSGNSNGTSAVANTGGGGGGPGGGSSGGATSGGAGGSGLIIVRYPK